MSYYWNQYQSNLIKRGEPPSHAQACRFVGKHLRNVLKLEVSYKWDEYFSLQWCKDEMLEYNMHRYDVAGFGWMYHHELEPYLQHARLRVIVEVGDIGDDTRHNRSHMKVLINDGMNKKWINKKYGMGVAYYKIHKGDCSFPGHLRKTIVLPAYSTSR